MDPAFSALVFSAEQRQIAPSVSLGGLMQPQRDTPPRDKNVAASGAVYSETARRLHWWTVALVAIMLPLGFGMVYRGTTLNIWDGLTDRLYNLHKLLGFVLLWLVVYRLYFRLKNGAPPDEPTLLWWQKAAAHATHWGLYALLIIMALLGWHGVSRYGAREVFGLFSLPPLGAQDRDASATVFYLHYLGGLLMVGMIAAHVGGALMHYFVFKDGVLRRMLPGLKPRD
jgi:cytochrome b561